MSVRRLPAPLVGFWQWQQHGACRGHDTDLFFYPDGARAQERHQLEDSAKALCEHCPVQLACRAHALAVNEPYGVWGGLTESERSLVVADGTDAAPPDLTVTHRAAAATSATYGLKA